MGVGDLDDDERESIIDDHEDDNFDTRSARSKTMSIRSGVSRTKRNALQAKMQSAQRNAQAEEKSVKSSRTNRRSPMRKQEEVLP